MHKIMNDGGWEAGLKAYLMRHPRASERATTQGEKSFRQSGKDNRQHATAAAAAAAGCSPQTSDALVSHFLLHAAGPFTLGAWITTLIITLVQVRSR